MSWFSRGQQKPQQAANQQDFQNQQRLIANLSVEIESTGKELKMMQVLQKEYTIDLLEFSKWQEMLTFRATCMGKLSFFIG